MITSQRGKLFKMAGQCLAWLLLVTYIGVMFFSGGATIWTFIGFKLKPSRNSSKVEVEPTNAYPGSSHSFSFTDDANERRLVDLKVITPCGTSAVVSMVIVLIGVCSRSIFKTTQAIHGSLSLAVLHIVMMVMLLLSWEIPGTILWIVGVNAGALAVCIVQVVIGVIYLKWQQKAWITLNFKELFTLNSCLFIGRTVLAGFHIAVFSYQLYWFNSRSCYQIDDCSPWSFYFCAVCIVIGMVLNAQCLLSAYFGSLHRCYVILSSLILTVGYGCVSVVTSPLYFASIYKERWYMEDLFAFSVALFSLHLIHLILLAVTPNVMGYSLFEVKLMEALRAIPYFVAITNEQLQSSRTESLLKRNTFQDNMISLVVSFVTLILISVSYWWYPLWAQVVLASVNFSLLSRSLNAVLYEAITLKVATVSSFQNLLFIIIEGLAAFVGFVGICTRGDALPIIGGVGLLGIYIMKVVYHRKLAGDILKTFRRDLDNEHLEEESDNVADTLSETETLEEA